MEGVTASHLDLSTSCRGPAEAAFPMNRLLAALVFAAVLGHLPTGGRARPPATSSTEQVAGTPARGLPTETKQWIGDFDGMLERRAIRVLVPYSRSLYFNDGGRERGIAADTVRAFEDWLNKKYATSLGNRPLTVMIVPTTRDRLLQDVADGRGDIAVGNLTITEERLRVVDFVSDPKLPGVNEVAVTGSRSPAIASAEQLAGDTVHVRRASSYFESLGELNHRLASEGKLPANLVLVPDALEDEDMMEMLDAGILKAIIVDDWKARMWAQVLPRIRVNAHAVLRSSGQIGWGIRKGSPGLSAEVTAYLKAEGTRTIIADRLNRYMRRIAQMNDPTAATARERFDQMIALFAKYGERYRFDPLMLAAQGYQESKLNQDARSNVGAIGVMQVMPATGQQLGVGDVHLLEPNIHAGAKFMDQLMTRYFPNARFDEVNRTLFAFASYNAGAAHIARMREEAEKDGLDPDQWFNNVEVVTARRIGIQTPTYVRNIYKYFVAYKLMEDARAAERRAVQDLGTGTAR
jgi:membrane-bound lytic murein transglycosylase MltF